MKLASVLSLMGLASSAVAVAIPAMPEKPDGFDSWKEDFIDKRAGYYAITGTSNPMGNRIELRTLVNQHPNMLTLTLLGLQAFYNTNQNQMLSYFAVSGIHGAPNNCWNGVGCSGAEPGSYGYCTHNVEDFPCFHRAYVALFEQVLYQNILNVVQTFQGTSLYSQMVGAASLWKLAYYDWAINPGNGLSDWPAIFSSPTWNTQTPSGIKNLPNPMYQYTFQSPYPGAFGNSPPFSTWSTTKRSPNSDASNAQSQNSITAATFSQQQQSLAASVYNMFTSCSDFTSFSNTNPQGATAGCSNSLEGIHDTVHGDIGGSGTNSAPTAGHMSYLQFAAFDPAFWFHHCQIDRLFAMWQVIYPNSYAPGSWTSVDTHMYPAGESRNINSPQYPFTRDSSGDFHTCGTVQNWKSFNYDYPETAQANGNSQTMQSIVNELYGPNSAAARKRDLVGSLLNATHEVMNSTHAITSSTGSDNYEYIANIITSSGTLSGPYSILVSLGELEGEPASWPYASNLCGSYNVLATPGTMNMTVSSSVILTPALKSKLATGILSSLSPEIVVPLLQELLVWQIVLNGTSISPDSVPDFKLSVVSAEVYPAASSSSFPTYSSFTTLNNVTHGKAGGVQLGECAFYD